MRSRCVRHTKFPVGTVSVPNRLQSLPSHPRARRERGKRGDLLQCFKFFETVSVLWYHHHRLCAWLPPSEGRSHSAVSSTHFWLVDTTQRFGGPGNFFFQLPQSLSQPPRVIFVTNCFWSGLSTCPAVSGCSL